jgi:hypothetical protein
MIVYIYPMWDIRGISNCKGTVTTKNGFKHLNTKNVKVLLFPVPPGSGRAILNLNVPKHRPFLLLRAAAEDGYGALVE